MTDERLPIPLEPLSSDEYAPLPLSPVVQEARKQACEKVTDNARRLAMPRRDFLRTAMASAAVLMTLDACSKDKAKSEGRSPGGTFNLPKDSDLDDGAARSVLDSDLPVLDAQSHFLEYDLSQPDTDPFYKGFPHQNCGLKDHRACFSIDSYIQSMFKESETALAVISAIAAPGPREGALSVDMMNIARDRVKQEVGGDRILLHGLLAPSTKALSDVLDELEVIATTFNVVGWKAYTNNGRGWRLDDGNADAPQVGLASLQKILELNVPRVCIHKGISGGDEFLSPADVGPAAKQFPEIRFGVYHSGWEPGTIEGPYTAAKADIGINRLITSLHKAGIKKHTNVYAEIGTTWFNIMQDTTQAAHVLGKLVNAVGEDRVLWGTDSIWYGSPQGMIDAFRAFEISSELQEKHGYPAMTESLRGKILARNVGHFYDLDLSKVGKRSRPTHFSSP
jgi:uncharacterized protein